MCVPARARPTIVNGVGKGIGVAFCGLRVCALRADVLVRPIASAAQLRELIAI